MTDLEHAVALFEMGDSDLTALQGMLLIDSDASKQFFSDEIFGFHAQQAVEKILKAWIASMGENYPKSHDLMILIQKLKDLGEDVAELLPIVDLNPFAVQFRYDVLDPDDEELDRNELLKTISSLRDKIKVKINP